MDISIDLYAWNGHHESLKDKKPVWKELIYRLERNKDESVNEGGAHLPFGKKKG